MTVVLFGAASLTLRDDGSLVRTNLVDGTSTTLAYTLPLSEWGETVLVR